MTANIFRCDLLGFYAVKKIVPIRQSRMNRCQFLQYLTTSPGNVEHPLGNALPG